MVNRAQTPTLLMGPKMTGSARQWPAQARDQMGRGEHPPCSDAGGLDGIDEQGAEAPTL